MVFLKEYYFFDRFDLFLQNNQRFYEDFFREQEPSLPILHLKEFANLSKNKKNSLLLFYYFITYDFSFMFFFFEIFVLWK